MTSPWLKSIMTTRSEATKGILLVEPSQNNISLHELCVYAYIITCAKQLSPVFINRVGHASVLDRILPRYFEKFQVVEHVELSGIFRLFLFVKSVLSWTYHFFHRDLISLHWHGELVGDIIYDQYLAGTKKGTVNYFDIRLVKYIYIILRAIESDRRLLKKIAPVSVLLSHRVGLNSAPLAVLCQQQSIPIYSYGGGAYSTMIVSTIRKSYEYRTTANDLYPLLNLPRQDFDKMFESIQEDLFSGSFNADSKLAFSNKLFTDRSQFASMFSLDIAKKNIFVMLHAFTDYPHSHFNGMLFDDFLDWFIKTLEFASKCKSVNWIFKRHPSDHFYPVLDVDWDFLIQKYTSANLIFMSQDANFDSRSICYVGDATVTCLGSAGFEFGALARIPTITAGDNPYAEAGFAIYPKTQVAYFETLNNLHALSKLDDNAFEKARATFMFIHRLSRVPMHAFLNFSHSESYRLQHDDDFFIKIDQNAEQYEELIVQELKKYIALVSAPGFSALRTLTLGNLNKFI